MYKCKLSQQKYCYLIANAFHSSGRATLPPNEEWQEIKIEIKN